MSARSSDSRGRLEGRAVAGGGLGPAEHRDRRRPAAAGPGLRAGVDQGDEAARPDLEVAAHQVAVGHHGGGARVRRARGPPRPGPGGGSWARPRRRPGGRPSTRRASAARARGAGGCRRGRRARGRPRGGGGPWRWPRRPTRRRSWTRRRRPRRPSGRRTPRPCGPGDRPSTRLRVPQEAGRRGKLTPVSGSLQHGRCASGGQSRGATGSIRGAAAGMTGKRRHEHGPFRPPDAGGRHHRVLGGGQGGAPPHQALPRL